MTNEIAIIDPKDFQIEESKAVEITSGLQTILAERQILETSYVDVIGLEITEGNIPTFKELRLKIRDNRTKGIEQWHKANKDFYLRGGQFVNAIKRKEVLVNEQMEEKLLAAAKDAEKLAKEPIKKQMSVWVSSFSIPENEISNETKSAIIEKFEAFKKWAESQIELL